VATRPVCPRQAARPWQPGGQGAGGRDQVRGARRRAGRCLVTADQSAAASSASDAPDTESDVRSDGAVTMDAATAVGGDLGGGLSLP